MHILLCRDAGHADQLSEGKAGLEKRSHTPLQRAWRLPLGVAPKPCSDIHLILELGCDKRSCPARSTAPGCSQGSGELEDFARARWAVPEALGKRSGVSESQSAAACKRGKGSHLHPCCHCSVGEREEISEKRKAGGRLPTLDTTPHAQGGEQRCVRSISCHHLQEILYGTACLIAATTKMSLCRSLLVKNKVFSISVLKSPADGLEPSPVLLWTSAPPDLVCACRSQR